MAIIPAGAIEGLIFEVRDVKVVLDIDLGLFFGSDTRKLKQQVKRNPERFPSDFMQVLTKPEVEGIIELNPRLATLKFSKVPPMVFTEQGVAMLASVMKTDRAIAMSIEIMRAFARYRALLMDNRELRREIRALDAKLNRTVQDLMGRIDGLATKVLVKSAAKPRKRIGSSPERLPEDVTVCDILDRCSFREPRLVIVRTRETCERGVAPWGQ